MKSNSPELQCLTALSLKFVQRWKRSAHSASGMGLAILFALSASRVIASTNGVVGEWLNGSMAGTNFLDVSGYSLATNHGAFVVGAGKYVFTNDVPPGHTGWSLFLYNGDTGLAISNSSTLDANYDNTFDDQINNSFTISFWAKGWPGTWNPFVSKYGETAPSPSGGWQVRADANNHPCWTVRGAGGILALGSEAFGNPDELVGSSVSLGNDGYWHYYIANFDVGTGARNLYVDGVLIASETNVTNYAMAPLEHLCIGCRDTDGSTIANFFTGEIYDVRISNYAFPAGDGCAIPLFIATRDIGVRYGQTTQLPAASGLGSNLGYGWTSNGVQVLNANTGTLTISNVTANATYNFYVTNACDETYSPFIFDVHVIFTNQVGRWFSGSQTLADVSGYQPPGTHDGEDIGNASGSYYFTNDVPPGRTGYSLYLTNDGIFIANSSTLDAAYTNTFDDTIHSAMTIAFWAKGSPGAWNPWISKRGDPSSGWQIHRGVQNILWTIQGTGSACAVPVGSLPYGNSADLAGTNVLVDDGNWHSYVGTFNSYSGIRNLYVDGRLSAEETCNGLYALAASEHLCVGAKDISPGGSFGNFFTGQIYDVRIATYDWNTNEVANYVAGVPNETEPIAVPLRVGNQLVLTWTHGTLQQATNPLGPWTSIEATSPYTNDLSTSSQRYYRLSYP